MKGFGRVVLAMTSCVLAGVPVWAQQAPPPARTSPIQKMIVVDQLVEQKEYEEAIRGYLDLLASDPRNPQILNRIGNVYLALQKARDAKKYYERALKADPHFAVAANNIGCIYYNDKRYAKAIGQYRKAIKMNPNVASFYSNLGYSYLGKKKYKDMMQSFRQAVVLDPSVFDQHNRVGEVELERSVEDRGAFYFYVAKTYGQMGDAERCIYFLTKARDEHFKDILTVRTDPAFAPVRPNPAMKEFIDELSSHTGQNPSSAAF